MMAGLRYNFNRPDFHESPLFERQIGDDFAELQQSRVLLERQQQRIEKLERINVDLERRLEEQAKQSMAVEAECIALDREWTAKYAELEEEVAKWKREYEKEKQRNVQQREQLSRAERELYVILQRSYELRRGGPSGGGPSSAVAAKLGELNNRIAENANQSSQQPLQKGGSEDEQSMFFVAKPTDPPRTREKKVLINLADFLGL